MCVRESSVRICPTRTHTNTRKQLRNNDGQFASDYVGENNEINNQLIRDILQCHNFNCLNVRFYKDNFYNLMN